MDKVYDVTVYVSGPLLHDGTEYKVGLKYPTIASVGIESKITLLHDDTTKDYFEHNYWVPAVNTGDAEILATVQTMTSAATFDKNFLQFTLGGKWKATNDGTNPTYITIEIPSGVGGFATDLADGATNQSGFKPTCTPENNPLTLLGSATAFTCELKQGAFAAAANSKANDRPIEIKVTEFDACDPD
jgi:hypothetical protein